MAIFAALSIMLSSLESLFAPLLPLGVKPGLANIAVMFVCAEYGLFPALLIALCKAFFALAARGVVAFCMSLAGGIASSFVMWLFFRFFQERLGLASISVAGALSHNIAQLLVSLLLLGKAVLYYAPVLLLLALPCGLLTGVILKATLSVVRRAWKKAKEKDGS